MMVPPTTVFVPDTNAVSGWPVTVPILVVASGEENGMSLSLNFGAQSGTRCLHFTTATLGQAAS